MSNTRIGMCPVCGEDIHLDPDGAYCKICDTYFGNYDLGINNFEYDDNDDEIDWSVDNAIAQYRANIDKYR